MTRAGIRGGYVYSGRLLYRVDPQTWHWVRVYRPHETGKYVRRRWLGRGRTTP